VNVVPLKLFMSAATAVASGWSGLSSCR
jgi:hypothetical protein